MSFWIPNTELNKEVMEKRSKHFENLYFSIFSTENMNVFHNSCFKKCVQDFSSENLSYSEKNCLFDCKRQVDIHNKKFLEYYGNLMDN